MDEGEQLIWLNNPFWGWGTSFSLLIQIALIVHVLRTGRPYWWIWVILLAPGIGSIVYIVVEVLPGLRRGRVTSWRDFFKTRRQRIRELQRQLEETDTVDTRLALAAELSAADRLEEARTLLAECLNGVFHDDPHVLLELARVQLKLGDGPGALDMLGRFQVERDKWLELKQRLLLGWALHRTGRLPEAETLLCEVSQTYPGEEARYRLAKVLWDAGNKPEATRIFREIIQKYRKATPQWRRAERPWFRQARADLKAAG